MPLCQVCKIYFTINPCPNCTKPTSKRINESKTKKIKTKNIWLCSNADELDFIWAQVSHKTTQRVQHGNNSLLRQGYFELIIENNLYRYEMIGSTFNQHFLSRLERLYPGIRNIFIVLDIVNQTFLFPPLQEILDDVITVNKRNLDCVYIVWLEPYINIQNQYDDFKNDVKFKINEYLETRIGNRIEELILPMFSTQRFSQNLKQLFSKISNNNNVLDFINLPLRPLFRTQRPILDPGSSNRVIILNLESSPQINSRKIVDSTASIDLTEKIKCLACNHSIDVVKFKCLTCQSNFCNVCIETVSNSSQEFCLGSIYHGLHRISILK